MTYEATPAQRVIEHAIERGYVTTAQVERALLGGQTHDGLLPLLRPHLTPEQLADLQSIYRDQQVRLSGVHRIPQGGLAEDGESTAALSRPDLEALRNRFCNQPGPDAPAGEGTVILSAGQASGIHPIPNLAGLDGSGTFPPGTVRPTGNYGPATGNYGPPPGSFAGPATGNYGPPPGSFAGPATGNYGPPPGSFAGPPPHAQTHAQQTHVPQPSNYGSTASGAGGVTPRGPTKLPEIGDTVGGFEIQSEIARGAMGVVYVGQRDALKAAVKVMLGGEKASDSLLKRFEREAKALGKLNHDHVVRVHEAGRHGACPYIAMDLVEGESLGARIKGTGKLDPREAARMTENLARALEHCHERGVVHRDLKPDNILLDSTGRARITDFGLVKSLESDHERLTKTGEMLGTPSYMPPEQANGKKELMGEGSDIYSLGATLYAALAGKPPFKGQTTVNTITQLITQPPPSLTKQVEGLDVDLETICFKCLEKLPQDRYRSAGELADDLGRYLLGQPIQARPLSPFGRMRRKLLRNRPLALAGLVLLLALLGLVGLAIKKQVMPDTERAAAEVSIDVAAVASTQHGQQLRLEFSAQPITAKVRLRVGDGDWRPLPISKRYEEAFELDLGTNTFTIEAKTADATRTTTVEVACLSPDWWNAQDPDERVPYPLPDDLAFHTDPGTFVHEKSGVHFVYTPPGSFTLGLTAGENQRLPGEDTMPPHLAHISRGFFLAKYELTRGEYRAFCRDTGRDEPVGSEGDERLPMVLSWNQAQEFCAWAGLRLPTEAEWEYAAEGGKEERIFPWGVEEPTARHCNKSGDADGFAGPSPVGSFPDGASRWGCLDMSGNVWEWVEDTYARYPKDIHVELTDYVRRGDKNRVYRGGGFQTDDLTHLCADYREKERPSKFGSHRWSSAEAGVRVARSE